MPRAARWVVPEAPHHIIQRGSRRQQTFFQPDDHAFYLNLMAEQCQEAGVEIWAYCLMPNHVHLIAVPASEGALATALGGAHRRYSARINRREGWSGHLWQGRFISTPMDERHLLAAARYVELNPVRAGLTADPVDYPWSSARAHVEGRDDRLLRCRPLLDRVPEWRDLLRGGMTEGELKRLRGRLHYGWPLGEDAFLDGLETRFGRPARPAKAGRPAKQSKTGHNQGQVPI